MVKSNCLAYVLLLTLLCYCESRRSHGTGGRRGGHTTPRNNYHPTQNYQRSTEANIGFERYQPPQNTRHDIGFENMQSRVPPNTQTHGGQPQYQTHYNPVSNSNPSAPLPPANHNYNPSAPLPPGNHNTNPQPGPGIGFDNVNQRAPQHPYNSQPNNPYNNHPPPQYPGSYPGNYNPAGHYNPPYNSYQPPPTYYNPQYSSPAGVPPQIYQPVQQSSGGGSLLGYAGTFAGGALIGHLLTSRGGGGGGGSNVNGGDQQYSVHHYYHDANAIPKQMSVSTNSLMMCNTNETQGLCVPNTFAICLSNGTIMCVTHSMYTTPCGGGNNLTCVITVLPCSSNDTSCNATAGANSTTSAVYIPCISNVTVSQQNLVTSDANSSSNQNVQYCVTAIAEPKKLESPVASYASFLQEIAKMVYQMTMANSTSTESPVITSEDKSNKTDIATLMPLGNENKTEITTLSTL